MGDTNVLLPTAGEQPKKVEFPVTQGVILSSSGPQNWTSLSTGIDSLYLALSVDWTSVWSVLQPKLREAKEAVEGRCSIEMDLGIGRSVLLPSGRRNYRYNIYLGGWNLLLADSPLATSHPNAYAMLHPWLLWNTGPQQASAKVSSTIEQVGGIVREVVPSRVDLCADFVIHPALTEAFLKTHQVCRCRIREAHHDGDRLRSYIVGDGSVPIRMQIYNKGEQVESADGSEWFKDVWKVNDARNVWRVEFQARRQLLSELDVNTIDDLLTGTGSMWNYLTTKWFSLRNPDNCNTARRTVHPWWQSVQAAADGFAPQRPMTRVYRRGQGQSLERSLSRWPGASRASRPRSGSTIRKSPWTTSRMPLVRSGNTAISRPR